MLTASRMHHLHCFVLIIIDTIVITKVVIDIVVVVTTEVAICQQLQKDLTTMEHLNFDFDSITQRQMDSTMVDGNSKRFVVKRNLVPLPSCLQSFDQN